MLILNKLKARVKQRMTAGEFLLASGHAFTPK